MITECVESALVELYTPTSAALQAGVALAAVGSLARRELGPRSDIDLVLLHDGKASTKINTLASDLWYPLWDARIRAGPCSAYAGGVCRGRRQRAERRCRPARSAGLAGDAELVKGARTALLDTWRGNARKRLPELLASLDERLATFGDAAYLLEPDLKEARGGFRDMSMLRALAASWLTDRPHVGIREPYERLLDVRDALHQLPAVPSTDCLPARRRPSPRGWATTDADDLHRDVSMAARRIGHAVDLTVRAARQALPQRRVLSFIRA